MAMRSIAIITARGGSKRIPGKNIRPFLGKPIIEYTIEAALASGCFDTVMVSTEDRIIAEISRKAGADIPFCRSETTAGDSALLADVVEEVLAEYGKLGQEFESLCLMLPTAPFLTPERIQEGQQQLESSGADAVIPVVRFSAPIQRAFRMTGNQIEMMWPENMHVMSNTLEPGYYDCGQFYGIRTQRFLQQKRIFGDNTLGMEISEMEAQDIDSEDDWKLAELKYQILHFTVRNIVAQS